MVALARWSENSTDQLKFIQRCSECAVAGTAFHYALLSSGEIVGMVSFNSIEKLNRCATMDYWLAKSQTGRGLMRAAVKALIDWGFQNVELNRFKRGLPRLTIQVRPFATG